MDALFGTFSDPLHNRSVQLARFMGPPLRIAEFAGWQGQCDTFVFWSKFLHTEGDNPFTALIMSLDQPSVPHDGTPGRPGWWDTISTGGILTIRHSPFLFARKFVDKP